MAMGRKRRKRRKPDVQNVSAFVEECCNEVFESAEPADVPKFTYCFRLWDRLCIAAVISADASEVPLIAMDVIRKQVQSNYKIPACLIMYHDDQKYTWKRCEDRVVQLLSEHGGEAS